MAKFTAADAPPTKGFLRFIATEVDQTGHGGLWAIVQCEDLCRPPTRLRMRLCAYLSKTSGARCKRCRIKQQKVSLAGLAKGKPKSLTITAPRSR